MEKRAYQRKLSRKLADESFYCPRCTSLVHWGCRSNTGYAYCSKSSTATRIWVPGVPLTFCEWEGKCKRRPDGKVEIFYIEEIQAKE